MISKTSAQLSRLPMEDEAFQRELELFEADRLAEDEELRLAELKESEDAKKKDNIDLELFYPSNYYSSVLGKSKVTASSPHSLKGLM